MEQSNGNRIGKITFIQAFMVMMLFNGLTSHVIVNPMLLDASGRDAWITVLLTGALYVPWCAVLVYIMNKSRGQKLQTWLTRQTNAFVAWLLLIPVCIQLYLIGIMTILHTTIWTVSNYLPATPQYVLIIALVVVCHICAKYGLGTIAVGAGILLPVVVCLGYFVSIANHTEKDYNLLRPILENGWSPVIDGSVYAGGAFVELFLLLLLQHRLKKKARAWQVMLLGLVLVYITLGPIVGAITEFGPKEAAKQMVSPYEQWRLVKLGNYIEHVDFLSVFQWLAGASVRISLAQFLLADILPFRTPKSRGRFITIITLSFLAMAVLISQYNTFYLQMFQYYFPISLIITLIITTTWAVLAWFAKPAKEGTA
ncbi:spore gernimation protein [Paenibacillus mesophilus]|uniref:endospore germination permease n=1 Tax=Paenibacillus mesophilus TaxID=2582849 RepID=UPI00110EBBB4|nr:endospore germination permease [Paenibacillus mesophilus]TMV45521.1 spore gernimation protein [Paenibacillus mesophilus]